jgi:hypothetical protein
VVRRTDPEGALLDRDVWKGVMERWIAMCGRVPLWLSQQIAGLPTINHLR